MKKTQLLMICTLLLVAGAVYGQPNDDCVNAIPISAPSVTAGSTVGASDSVDDDSCGTSATAAGVWYSTIGSGNTMTASTCPADSAGSADYDTKIHVFCDDCAIQTCVDGNDDSPNCGFPEFLSTVSWPSIAGAPYLIYVSGFGSAEGNFNLALDDDGVPAGGAVTCSVPVATGACCYGDVCEGGVDEDTCVSGGGLYLGDDTQCGDDSCAPVPTAPWTFLLLLGTVLLIGVTWMLAKRGSSRSAVVGMMIVAALLLVSAAAIASDGSYTIGDETYQITKADDRYNISDSSRNHVGHMRPMDSGRQEVFDAGGASLGVAESFDAGMQMIHDSR